MVGFVHVSCSLAYLHEAIEPKVVHRDIKSSNILIDDEFNGKVSDFGLAKLLGAGKSHVTTRVMGTFGYLSPASSEPSDFPADSTSVDFQLRGAGVCEHGSP